MGLLVFPTLASSQVSARPQKSSHRVWHRNKLPAFAKFLQDNERSLKVGDLPVEDARAFIKHLMERTTRYSDHVLRNEMEGGLAPSAIHGYVRSLRTFASWLQREGYTDENIFEGLKPPKLPQILIQPLTEDEIRKILLLIPQNTAEGARNYAIVLTFLDTAIRLSELLNLKISDIDFSLGQFKVFGKGAKERLVPMGYATRRAILRYRDTARPQPVNPNETRLFLSVAGTPISQESVEKLIQRLRRPADIPRLHPHLFRHSFAVRYLINGGDVFTLQKILGHTTLEMTRRYVTLASSDVKEKHRLYSPIDNLGLAAQQRGRPKLIDKAVKQNPLATNRVTASASYGNRVNEWVEVWFSRIQCLPAPGASWKSGCRQIGQVLARGESSPPQPLFDEQIAANAHELLQCSLIKRAHVDKTCARCQA